MTFFLPGFPFGLWETPRQLKHPRSELAWNSLGFEPEVDLGLPSQLPTSLRLRLEKGGQGWVGQVGLPGIRSKRNLSVDVDNDSLRVFAKSPSHTYSHIVSIPEGADTSRVEAEFEDGVLTIAIPRLRKKLKLTVQSEEEKKAEQEKNQKEEEASRLALIEEKKKKTERFWRRLAGPIVSSDETDTQVNTKIEYSEPVAKENFDIEVENGVMIISFNLKDAESDLSFKNLIRLPEGIKDEQISATVEGNCLILSYPKPEKKKPFKITITNETKESAPAETAMRETNETSDSEREKKTESESCENNTVEITGEEDH